MAKGLRNLYGSAQAQAIARRLAQKEGGLGQLAAKDAEKRIAAAKEAAYQRRMAKARAQVVIGENPPL